MRLLIVSSLALTANGAVLNIKGTGSSIMMGGSKLTSQCNTEAQVKYMALESELPATILTDSADSLTTLPSRVMAYFQGMTIGCGESPIDQPCALPAGEPDSVPLFYCTWTGPSGQVAVTGPFSAHAEEFSHTVYTHVQCDAPEPQEFRSLFGSSGALTGKVTIAIKHYVKMSADDEFSTAAREITYRGPHGGNQFTAAVPASPPPVPPSPPPPPPRPPPPGGANNGKGGTYTPAGNKQSNAKLACESFYGQTCTNSLCGSCNAKGYIRQGNGNCGQSDVWNYYNNDQGMSCNWPTHLTYIATDDKNFAN